MLNNNSEQQCDTRMQRNCLIQMLCAIQHSRQIAFSWGYGHIMVTLFDIVCNEMQCEVD